MKSREQIVDAHARALLHELRESGFPAIGVAGGIVLEAMDPETQSNDCHVFYLLEATVVATSNTDLGDHELGQLFFHDVARTMLRKE